MVKILERMKRCQLYLICLWLEIKGQDIRVQQDPVALVVMPLTMQAALAMAVPPVDGMAFAKTYRTKSGRPVGRPALAINSSVINGTMAARRAGHASLARGALGSWGSAGCGSKSS